MSNWMASVHGDSSVKPAASALGASAAAAGTVLSTSAGPSSTEDPQ